MAKWPNKKRGRPARSNELAKIHIAKGQLGLDDDTYRAMLWSVARVRSAKDLDAGGREAVLKHLRAVGWKDKAPSPGANRYQPGTPPALIRWLWTQLAEAGLVRENSDRALRRYIAQHAAVRPDPSVTEIAPQHLDRQGCNQVIEQLKRWLARGEDGP